MAITVSKLLASLPSATEQTQKLEEASNALTTHMAGILKELGKECSASIMQHIAKSLEQVSAPAYVSPPPYLTQRPPQIIYVFIDDLPGLN